MIAPARGPQTLARQGAWQPGDPPGNRQFMDLFRASPLRLENGTSFGPITLAYESWGKLDPRGANGVLLLHGFSRDSHAAGSAAPGHPSPGWWDGLIGPGRAIDTDRFFVVAPNAFGGCQGSTGPASAAADGQPYGSRFPNLTIRDLVAAERALAESLGIGCWHAVIGGSMGAMRALEWAIGTPDLVERLVLIAGSGYASAEVLGLHSTQTEAIRLDHDFHGGNYYQIAPAGPRRGLALARAIAQLSYGGEQELTRRFHRRPLGGQEPPNGGTYAVEAYLQDQSRELVERFDANSYLVLTRAMDHHDVGRGRGGLACALARVTARTQVVSVSSDKLFPPRLQRELALAIPEATYELLDSDQGHDGFLVELDKLAPMLRRALGSQPAVEASS
ncbi:homoserine O-acetyltransferase [Synechococcus sp. Tobar12-5m-g]|nr:homoserine O-acetyltransferase [Synechococcus sp. Tobar12-5m-g]MCP9873801.1 homoserine O-acetyltransferase [Synechococcus sp. Cruz CV-v-12]